METTSSSPFYTHKVVLGRTVLRDEMLISLKHHAKALTDHVSPIAKVDTILLTYDQAVKLAGELMVSAAMLRVEQAKS